MVLLSGDLFDGDNVYRETVEELTGMLESIRCPVFITPGNHDFYRPRSPYTKMSQNELAIQMMGLGVFNPQLAEQALLLLDMMDFKGRDDMMRKIGQNKGLLGQLKEYQQMALSLAKKYEPQMAQGLEAAMMKGLPFPPQMNGVRPCRISLSCRALCQICKACSAVGTPAMIIHACVAHEKLSSPL